LAERAIAFDQTYCAIPICTPSRATILTGLWPHTHGALHNNIPLPSEAPTIAERLRSQGYRCGYAGQWHLGEELHPQHGFLDSWSSIEGGHVKDCHRDGFSTYQQWLYARGFTPPDQAADGTHVFSRTTAARLPEAAGKPAFLADAACRFLDTLTVSLSCPPSTSWNHKCRSTIPGTACTSRRSWHCRKAGVTSRTRPCRCAIGSTALNIFATTGT